MNTPRSVIVSQLCYIYIYMMIKWFLWSWCIKHIPHQQPRSRKDIQPLRTPALRWQHLPCRAAPLVLNRGWEKGSKIFKESNLKVKSIIFFGLYARMKDIIPEWGFAWGVSQQLLVYIFVFGRNFMFVFVEKLSPMFSSRCFYGIGGRGFGSL